MEAGGEGARSWYVTREEAERWSPSRRDGVRAAKEAELRVIYCSFIRDVGLKLRLPQVTIATATVLCHRFYLRQSHAKNEWQTVATVCIFLASKIEDTPCSLQHVAIVAYETIYWKDCGAAHRIYYHKEVLEKQKDLILVGETLLLSTIRFDFNIQHPYEPLKLALNNLGISQKEVKQAAINLINDALWTTLVVQFKPHYIAAGSLYLAAKFNNVGLSSEKGKVWWHEFDVAPKQLQAVIQQMTELFMRRTPCSIDPAVKPPPTPTPTPTERQQIISSSDAVMRHTHSSRRSLSNNFDREASWCMPVDRSANYKSTVCSARNEGNRSLQTHTDHSNFCDASFPKQSSWGALKADQFYRVFSGPKDLHATKVGDLIRHKRTIDEVGQHPAPNDKFDRSAWIRRQQRNVLVVEAMPPWKKQKLWSDRS